MNLEMNSKTKIKLADAIGWMLIIYGFKGFLSSIIWAITPDTTDKWFIRISMGIISFGLAGIIFKISNKEN